MVLWQFDTLNSAYRIYLWVTYGSRTKHGLRPYTARGINNRVKTLCVFWEEVLNFHVLFK